MKFLRQVVIIHLSKHECRLGNNDKHDEMRISLISNPKVDLSLISLIPLKQLAMNSDLETMINLPRNGDQLHKISSRACLHNEYPNENENDQSS